MPDRYSAARADRMEDRAHDANAEATRLYNQAHTMAEAIPFGQPILIGHHSETRDRNYRERIHNTFGRAFGEMDKAKHYESRAATARATAEGAQYSNPRYLGNRIKECESELHQIGWRMEGKYYSYSEPGSFTVTDEHRAQLEERKAEIELPASKPAVYAGVHPAEPRGNRRRDRQRSQRQKACALSRLRAVGAEVFLAMTNETASAVREARPGDVVYERNAAGYVLLGLVTVGGTMEDVPGRSKAQITYMHFSPRGMDPSGVNGNVYEWQPKWSLIAVTMCGTVQADYTLWSPGAEAQPAELAANVPDYLRPTLREGDGDTYDAITGEVWTCPECGSTTGQPMQWDHGTDPDTGYHDAGEGCTECTPGGRR